MKKPLLSIIYIYYNTPEEIADSIKSLKTAVDNISYETIIVNNNSPKPIPQILKKSRDIKIIENKKNLGFGKAINLASKRTLGKFMLIINPDTIFHKRSIKNMVEGIKKDSKIGVLGPQLRDQKGEILHSTGSMPKLPDALFVFSFLNKIWQKNPYSKKYWGHGIDRNKEQETETVGGACMLFLREAFDKVSGFDERFFMYFEEADICLRIKRAGYKIVYYPDATITHLVGRSSSDKKWIQKTFEESRFKFFQKYYGTFIAFLSEGFLRFSSSITTRI